MYIKTDIIRTAALSLMAMGMLSSCNFEEECPSRGSLVAYVENDSKEISPRGYEDRNLAFFPGADVAEQTFFRSADVFTSDTLQREVPSGTYDLLLYNKGTNIVDNDNRVNNDLDRFILRCPVEQVNGNPFLPKEQVFICAGVKKDIAVRRWETAYAGFVMRPLVKFISLHIHVKDDHVGKPVIAFKGYLSGVVSSKNPGTMKNGSDYGTQVFSGREKNGAVFDKNLWVFGVNGAVSNILTLVGRDADGKEYTVGTDLTGLLKHIGDDGVKGVDIRLDVSFKPVASLSGIEIAGWEDVRFPPVNLQ